MPNNQYILSLESASDTLGVALSDNNDIIAVLNYHKKNLHDRLLADITRRMLNDLSLGIDDVAAVAVSAGPGSFTGLRIAAAFAKGLCFGTDRKFIAVSNLEAYAHAALPFAKSLKFKHLTAVISSHKNILYFQKFNVADFVNDKIEMTTIEDFDNMDHSDSLIVGNAQSKVKNNQVIENFAQNSSEFIAKYAILLYNSGKFDNVDTFEPNYIQDFIPKTSLKTLNF